MIVDDPRPPVWRCVPLGEAAVLLQGQPATLSANRTVIALAAALESAALGSIQSIVPGISSLLVHFDPLAITLAEVEQRLFDLLARLELTADDAARLMTLPVQYGGACGPDLEVVAALTGLSPREVVGEHSRHSYRVLVIGFAPGFPYIGPVSSALTIPRRATPRAAVPAGSVAVAAGLTGVYPARLPGGWHIIGRTPLRLFDPHSASPALLAAGDQVRFEPLPDGVLP